MGYDLHIIRQEDWDNYEEDSNISFEEWLNYVKSDPELKLIGGYDLGIPVSSGQWQDRPGFTEWIGHPKANADYIPWFDYYKGSINTKNPDDATVKKMLEIAAVFNAKLRGDDGEYYDESYLTNGGYPVQE